MADQTLSFDADHNLVITLTVRFSDYLALSTGVSLSLMSLQDLIGGPVDFAEARERLADLRRMLRVYESQYFNEQVDALEYRLAIAQARIAA